MQDQLKMKLAKRQQTEGPSNDTAPAPPPGPLQKSKTTYGSKDNGLSSPTASNTDLSNPSPTKEKRASALSSLSSLAKSIGTRFSKSKEDLVGSNQNLNQPANKRTSASPVKGIPPPRKISL